MRLFASSPLHHRHAFDVSSQQSQHRACRHVNKVSVQLLLVIHGFVGSVSPANPRDELLPGVRALCPRVVTLVEQELNANTAPLAARFADACAHYGAVLESLDATMSRDSAQRARAESALANKAANAVAREGPDRVERCEVFGKWRARFGMAGLRPVEIGQGVADRVRARPLLSVVKRRERMTCRPHLSFSPKN